LNALKLTFEVNFRLFDCGLEALNSERIFKSARINKAQNCIQRFRVLLRSDVAKGLPRMRLITGWKRNLEPLVVGISRELDGDLLVTGLLRCFLLRCSVLCCDIAVIVFRSQPYSSLKAVTTPVSISTTVCLCIGFNGRYDALRFDPFAGRVDQASQNNKCLFEALVGLNDYDAIALECWIARLCDSMEVGVFRLRKGSPSP